MVTDVLSKDSHAHTPHEGVMHGPWKPLSEHGLIELQRWEGDEYDLTNIALQGLHQLHCSWKSIESALKTDNISQLDATALWDNNQAAYEQILDRHLTR